MVKVRGFYIGKWRQHFLDFFCRAEDHSLTNFEIVLREKNKQHVHSLKANRKKGRPKSIRRERKSTLPLYVSKYDKYIHIGYVSPARTNSIAKPFLVNPFCQ